MIDKDKMDVAKIDISLIDENFYDKNGNNLCEKKIDPEEEKFEKFVKIFKLVLKLIVVGVLIAVAIINRL